MKKWKWKLMIQQIRTWNILNNGIILDKKFIRDFKFVRNQKENGLKIFIKMHFNWFLLLYDHKKYEKFSSYESWMKYL